MNHEGPSAQSRAARVEAQRLRGEIAERLDSEDEPALAAKLRACGELLKLHCSNCGHIHPIERGCKLKWCPVCVRAIAAKRAARYGAAVALMEWPLFVTLTVPHDNTDPLTQLRRLRRGFGKLRHHKLWTARVRGGVAGLEVNSRSHEFHPHLHTVLDCRWLAWQTRPPQRGDSKNVIAAKCRAASDELGLSWARCLRVTSIDPNWLGTIYKVKRCDREGITTEILKYSVKGSDLVKFAQPIGPIIRALQATRLVTSFGSLFGKQRLDDSSKRQPRPCPSCGEEAWISDYEAEAAVRSTRDHRR